MPGALERERRLVLACLVRRPAEELHRCAEGIDWTAALALAAAHAALEPVAHALLAAALALPAEVRERLSAASADAAARNALLLHDLARAQACLRAAGVRSAAMKGAALLAAHCPSLSVRHLSDVDLLVAPAELARAAAALARAGVAPPRGALPALDGGTGPLARNPGAAHVRALETWGGMMLELHDRLPGGGAPAAEVVAAARRRDLGFGPLDVAAPDDLAGMLCRHVFAKHRDDVRLRARHVADLAWLEPGLDWRRVEARHGSGRGRRAIGDSRRLLAAARGEASGGARAAGRFGLLEQAPRAAAARLATAVAGTLAAPMRTLFPARRYMEARFRLRPGSLWTPLYYPWRIVRGLARRLRGQA